MVAAFENRSYIVDATCWRCGETSSIILNKDDLDDWMNGSGSIQDILHYLSKGERELLISNTCDACFHSLFSPLDIDE